jgi:hypothetical protein
VQALQGAQLLNMVIDELVVLFLRGAKRLAERRPLVEFDLLALRYPVVG